MATEITTCKTTEHLQICGQCADEIGRIVKEEIAAITERQPAVPEATEEAPKHFDADGIELSGLMTSHADIPNAKDHPVEYGDKCGICIARKRKAQDGGRGGGAAAVISALDRL